MHEAYLEFPEGRGGGEVFEKKIPAVEEGMEIFWNYTLLNKLLIIRDAEGFGFGFAKVRKSEFFIRLGRLTCTLLQIVRPPVSEFSDLPMPNIKQFLF